jgi:hypothetical protein
MRMKKGQIILTLTLGLFAASVAWAQEEQPAPSPVPAFGQETPTPAVTENPPISAIDQPGLEPHAAPESFLMTGLHFSESVDSNVADTLGGSSTSSVTRGLGSVTLQKLWRNYDVAMDYIGGVDYYHQQGVGLEQVQQFDMDNRINWKRGQLAVRDSFSYLPEGTFGFGAYGGGGAYGASFGTSAGGMLGGTGFGGQGNAFFSGNGISVAQVPRLTNLGLADVVEELTPKSSVTLAAGYGIAHFYGNLENLAGAQENLSFVGSSQFSGQFGYDRILNPKDQIAVSYGYQAFHFSTVDSAFHSHVIQVMYGHRISGRMDFTIGVGPQFTHLDANPLVCDTDPSATTEQQCMSFFGGMFVSVHQAPSHIGAAGRASLRYKFSKATVSASYARFNTSGNGIYAGSRSDTVHFDARRPLTRVWDIATDIGYAKNSRLQIAGSTVSAGKFSYSYAGVAVHRQLGRSLKAFVSYQYNYFTFSSLLCPAGSSEVLGACFAPGVGQVAFVPGSDNSQRHVGTIGLDWTPRPIRLD